MIGKWEPNPNEGFDSPSIEGRSINVAASLALGEGRCSLSACPELETTWVRIDVIAHIANRMRVGFPTSSYDNGRALAGVVGKYTEAPGRKRQPALGLNPNLAASKRC